MAESRDAPKLDLLKIDFPVDRLTLGQLRRHEPQWFSVDNFEPKNCPIEALYAHCIELELASKAFARVNGQPDPHPNSDFDEMVETLNSAYVAYGISAGLHETREMARKIEQMAVAQITPADRRR